MKMVTGRSRMPSFPADCESLLSKCLTVDVYRALVDKTTPSGFTFCQAIRSGVVNLDSNIGVYAGDEESYLIFADLFDKVIERYHSYGKNDIHKSNLNASDLHTPNPDPDGDFIVSTRIRVGRNLAGFPLTPHISREQRQEVESQVVAALNSLTGNLGGSYYPLGDMPEIVRKQLVKDHFLFKAGDRFLEAAGANRDWPDNRGIFHSADKQFLVWVNEEDQLRIISMQAGGDVRDVFKRLTRAIAALEEKLSFAFNDHLGFISSCPSNLGTAMRASVHIKVPLASRQPNFKELMEGYGLLVRGIHGEHSESAGGVYDLSNKRRLGLTEVECVQAMYDGVVKLIQMEKTLQQK